MSLKTIFCRSHLTHFCYVLNRATYLLIYTVVPIPLSHSAVKRIHSTEMVLTVIFFMIRQYLEWTVLLTKHLRIAFLPIDPSKNITADMFPKKNRILESGMSHGIHLEI
jgi:hypothetical protein